MKQLVKRLADSTTTALLAIHANRERVEDLAIGWVASWLLMMNVKSNARAKRHRSVASRC